MEIRVEEIQRLSHYLEMREIKAEGVVNMVSNPHLDIKLQDEDKILIEYNYYVVSAHELAKKIGIKIEKSDNCRIASKIWKARRKAIIKRNPDAWVI